MADQLSKMAATIIGSRGKAAWGFGADRFRILVSMATDSSHRVIVGKKASSRFHECF